MFPSLDSFQEHEGTNYPTKLNFVYYHVPHIYFCNRVELYFDISAFQVKAQIIHVQAC